MFRVLIDVTQYATWPARSGIQRVVLHLVKRWKHDHVAAEFGILDRNSIATGPLDSLARVIARSFDAARAGIDETALRGELRAATTGTVSRDRVGTRFDGYLLPEPTLQPESLALVRRLEDSPHVRPLFIYYDTLPLTHPEVYPRGADRSGVVTWYHQVVSRSDDVAFISAATKRTFEERIARRRLANGAVVKPGADGVTRTGVGRSPKPTFTVVGTVEPRKRHAIVIDALERLWAAGSEIKLVVVGAAGWERPDFLARLRELSTTRRVDWIERADDEEVAVALGQAWGVVFPSSAEGYGLPALEALAAGCPVIVPDDLPALEGLEPWGQVRLETIDSESLASAIAMLAQPDVNASYREAIRNLRLPSWDEFANGIEEWTGAALEGRAGDRAMMQGVAP